MSIWNAQRCRPVVLAAKTGTRIIDVYQKFPISLMFPRATRSSKKPSL